VRISLHQLRLFSSVAEHGSLARAAPRMHITQAALSLQLKDLAETLGAQLIERAGRQQSLTAAGERTLAAAREIESALDRLEAELAELKGLRRGRLKIAAATTAEYFVPGVLGEFQRLHPGIEIELTVATRAQVLARLREHRDDLYVMARPPADADLADHVFMANPLVVIAPRQHRFASRRRLRLEDLRGEPFVLREEGSGTRMIAEAWLAGTGFRPLAKLSLGSNEAVKKAVAAGFGLAIVSMHAVEDAERENLAVLPVKGFPIDSQWHLVHPAARALSPPARAFLEYALGSVPGRSRPHSSPPPASTGPT
jgi:DNA-binding transcriptional LysR family regulator